MLSWQSHYEEPITGLGDDGVEQVLLVEALGEDAVLEVDERTWLGQPVDADSLLKLKVPTDLVPNYSQVVLFSDRVLALNLHREVHVHYHQTMILSDVEVRAYQILL